MSSNNTTNQTATQLNKTNKTKTQKKPKQSQTKCQDNGISGRKTQKLIQQIAVSRRWRSEVAALTHTAPAPTPAAAPNTPRLSHPLLSPLSSPPFPGEADP